MVSSPGRGRPDLEVEDGVVGGVAAQGGDLPPGVTSSRRMSGRAWRGTSWTSWRRSRPRWWSLREERLHEGVELRYELQSSLLTVPSLGEIFLQLLFIFLLHHRNIFSGEGVLLLDLFLCLFVVVVIIVMVVSVSVLCKKDITS